MNIEEQLHRPRVHDKDVPFYVCLEDWRIMRQYGITEAQIRQGTRVKLATWH
jgi:hypothetical protein